jgi:hypothetical protein
MFKPDRPPLSTPLPELVPAQAGMGEGREVGGFLVPKVGLEPTRLSPPPPQDGVSTSSTTPAIVSIVGWI